MQNKVHNPTFPQYRKYPNGRSYFKIISLTEFEEIQEARGKYVKYHFIAKILPDHNYINDLVFNYHDHWQMIEKEEYEGKREMCEKN